jgi:hypothetical protein
MTAANCSPAVACHRAKCYGDFRVPTLLGAHPLDHSACASPTRHAQYSTLVLVPCRYCASSGCAPKGDKVVTIFGAAARYRRATAGRIYDDAHPDNSTLHVGAVRPHTGFVMSPIFQIALYGPLQFAGVRNAAIFLCISFARAFRAGGDASIFFSGPVEAEERHSCPVSTGWLFWRITAHPLV